jgi:hypothetical protein
MAGKSNASLYSNFEALGELLGGLSGIAEGMDTDTYLGGVIRQAHSEATNIFDQAAAATAKTGRLQHVYEYGTTGVTTGRPTFKATDQAARLWVHEIGGQGKNQIFGFFFRPATQPNPQPTTASTGVASKYLRKLSRRKHIFRQKAMIIESGAQVTIKPKNGNLLFVPFYGEPATNPRNTRGFAMSKGPITMTPGATSQGTFTAFWEAFWASQGNVAMGEAMTKTITKDVNMAVSQVEARAQAAGRKMTRIESDNVRYASSRARRWSEKLIKEYGVKHANVGNTG